MCSEMRLRGPDRLFVALSLPLPLSLHLTGPMGEAAVASHVLLLTNDQVAATVLMNYAGRKGSNSTLSYVNLTLRQREESCSGGGELVPSITRRECVWKARPGSRSTDILLKERTPEQILNVFVPLFITACRS